MRRVILTLLFFLFAAPASAHHTREHILGAPSPPATVTAPVTPEETGGNRLLWALGPFFLLVAIGALRWAYRHHRDGKNKGARD